MIVDRQSIVSTHPRWFDNSTEFSSFFYNSLKFLDNGYFLPVALSTILDRKSTRLNSSHGYISYAVFCLKKKKKKKKKLKPHQQKKKKQNTKQKKNQQLQQLKKKQQNN